MGWPAVNRNTIRLIAAGILIFPAVALAAERTSAQPQWYEIVGGVLALPATLLGLAYSYALIRKTRIESRKLELEIREKEIALKGESSLSEKEHRENVGAAIRDSLVASILLRFALMFVVLQLWSVVQGIFGSLLTGTYLGLHALDIVGDPGRISELILFGSMQLPRIATWIIVLTLGIPLLREISGYLGVGWLGILKKREP